MWIKVLNLCFIRPIICYRSVIAPSPYFLIILHHIYIGSAQDPDGWSVLARNCCSNHWALQSDSVVLYIEVCIDARVSRVRLQVNDPQLPILTLHWQHLLWPPLWKMCGLYCITYNASKCIRGCNAWPIIDVYKNYYLITVTKIEKTLSLHVQHVQQFFEITIQLFEFQQPVISEKNAKGAHICPWFLLARESFINLKLIPARVIVKKHIWENIV